MNWKSTIVLAIGITMSGCQSPQTVQTNTAPANTLTTNTSNNSYTTTSDTTKKTVPTDL